MKVKRGWRLRFARFFLLSCTGAFGFGLAARGADTLIWQTNHGRVSADIKSGDLLKVLSQIASVTHWRVYVEPGSAHPISTKFKDLPQNEALHLLLGELNFALVAETNGPSKLLVFSTTMRNATQFIRPAKQGGQAAEAKPIPNELIVRLKPGAKIEDLARLVGAKVVGRIDSLNAYRLQFDDAASADAAREQLAAQPQPDVSSVEDNYTINRPEVAQSVSANVPPLSLQLNPPPANGRVIIGLIDTAVQPLGNGLDQFLLKQESLAGDPQLEPGALTHGTAMTETMLRTLQLLGNGSSSINIKPYDIYGPNENANTFVLAQALAEAVNSGANPISLSLGSSADSPLVASLIRDGSTKGITFYAAVGNGSGAPMEYPAADTGATPVTALERNGQIASYANQSDNSAIGALGTVLVPFNGQTFAVSGTSPATAIVSGTAGYLMEKYQLTGPQANARLRSTQTQTTIPGK